MAGTWTAQNKVRPGAYVVFKAQQQATPKSGTRGIVTLPMKLSWGTSGDVVEITSQDLVRGTIYNKIGLRANDPKALPLLEAMKNAPTALVYIQGTGATAATVTLQGDAGTAITATAVKPGTLGNSITMSSVAKSGKFEVITTVQGLEVDRQLLTQVSDFVPNDWVILSGAPATAFEAFSGKALAGGTDGTVSAEPADYTAFMNAVKNKTWQCMAVPTKTSGIAESVVEYIQTMREDAGKKVQAVVYDYNTADYEGIISMTQGYMKGDTTCDVTVAICWMAGATAGAAINESNTYKVIDGATAIIDPMTDYEIEDALLAGKIVLSTRQDGAVVVEKDINTLHTYTEDRSYVFSKNRVIRCLDDIATSLAKLFELSYIGKVDNNESGRTLFKGDAISYMNELQDLGAIQNFDATTDIEVLPGSDIDSVVCNLWVQTVDAMEKLYMTVVVS